MEKYTASFLGRDCPGVVAAVSRLFGDMGCNIEAMAQTMLSGAFAAIFVVSVPEGMAAGRGEGACGADCLRLRLEEGLERGGVDLSVLVRPAIAEQWGDGLNCEPFVVTVDGPDRPGLIGEMSRVFGRHGVNIENLKAILGEGGEGKALFVFEVMVPDTVDLGRLRRELALEANNLNLRVSVQHRDIFEAVHRVSSF
ncbi:MULTISPECIES: ACT domain-containing protein [unclassified Desulfovibrio]|uniref:glycine cleavage system protein R n=1 Tax=unclassified Desulfovibrio TaxID=2593640 RepID=UPI0013E9A9E3|nr:MULTISPECIES: ACT domain-containing protein [unclassified Desulfovibrio]